MNLLLLDREEIASDGTVELTGRRAEHLSRVLHAKPGDTVKTGVLGGNLGRAEILALDRDRTRLRIQTLDTPPPAPKQLVPIIALPRPQSFKKTLHFIASAGIKRACFIATERVEKSYWNSQSLAPDAIEEELRLGLEQGVDTIPPELEFYDRFGAFLQSDRLKELTQTHRCLIAHPTDAAECPRALKEPAALAIGPEGGFLPREVEAFSAAGFEKVELGPYILRVEFALSYFCGRIS